MGPSSAGFAAILADSLDSGAPPRRGVLYPGTFVADTPSEAGEDPSERAPGPPPCEGGRIDGLDGVRGPVPERGIRIVARPSSIRGSSPANDALPQDLDNPPGVDCIRRDRSPGWPNGGPTPPVVGGALSGAAATTLTPAEQDLVDTGLVSPTRGLPLPENRMSSHGVSPSTGVTQVGGSTGGGGGDGLKITRSSEAVPGEAADGLAGKESIQEKRRSILDLGPKVEAVTVSPCGRYYIFST
jgi:hypothetical protein